MKIKAFGRMVSREKAYQIIVYDKICDVCHARNTEVLEELLIEGWAGLVNWTDKNLEDYIGLLSIENQPDGKI